MDGLDCVTKIVAPRALTDTQTDEQTEKNPEEIIFYESRYLLDWNH